MKRLQRNTLYTEANSLESRVAQLERRIIPSGGLPFCQGNANYLTETLTTGHFVNMGLQDAFTTDRSVYAHLPLVDGWVQDDTDNIDGCIVILQPGIYDLFAVMTNLATVPSNTQSVDLQIRSIDILDPLGTPTPSGTWAASEIVGTHISPPSLALGSLILSDSDWVYIRLMVGGGSTFRTRGIKPYLALAGAGSDLSGTTVTLMITQFTPLLCGSGNFFVITETGIPTTWENPC